MFKRHTTQKRTYTKTRYTHTQRHTQLYFHKVLITLLSISRSQHKSSLVSVHVQRPLLCTVSHWHSVYV